MLALEWICEMPVRFFLFYTIRIYSKIKSPWISRHWLILDLPFAFFCSIYCFIHINFLFFLANEHTDLTLINQRIRDNIQALNNFATAREPGR